MATESRVPTTQKGWLRFFRANFAAQIPDAQGRRAYTQTYATADRTHASQTAAAVVTSPAVTSSPAGWAAISQADAIITQLNALRTDHLDTAGVVNALIDDLQEIGLIS